MEGETLCSSDFLPEQPTKDSWSSANHQYMNGEPEALTWSEKGNQIHHKHTTEPLSLPPNGGEEPPEWPVPPMTCTAAALSFATVQWEMPDTASDPPSSTADSSLADVMGLNTPSSSRRPPHQVHAEGFTPGDEEEKCLNSTTEPCDAAEEAMTQEEEDSEHSDEEDRVICVTSDVETEGLAPVPEEAGGSEGGVDSVEDSTPEEEPEDVLLTGETEQTSICEVEPEVESEDEECVTNVCGTKDDEDAPVALQQTDHLQLTFDPDELINLQQRDISEDNQRPETAEKVDEVPTSRTEGLKIRQEVGQDVNPDQTETSQHDAEPDSERIETSQGRSEQRDSEEEASVQPEQLGRTEESDRIRRDASHQADQPHWDDSAQLAEMDVTVQPGQADPLADDLGDTEPPEQNDHTLQTSGASPPTLAGQLAEPRETHVSETATRRSPEAEVNQPAGEAETPPQAPEAAGAGCGSEPAAVASGVVTETAVPHLNGEEGVDREMVCRLARRLHHLDGIQRVDVVKHLDKDNDFSRAVGEEYLRFFDFTGLTVDRALRSFLKVVVLIGESQERERVLQHFACRFHQCNLESSSSPGPVFALTCALMLLNTDLHGQNVGKSMSSSKFVSNLDGMNEGENFSKDLLKSLYNSIKSEPLEWAVDEEELRTSVLAGDVAGEDAPLRSKSNPFQDVPHDKGASVVKQGFLQRKLHADVDGKRTPWGKRSWKTFCGVLRGMVLYLQKNDCRGEQQVNEEVVSVHHSLAEPAAEYHKKPHVFRLQTADWRVFLFQASSKMEMNSWISRINLVSALHSSPPFPAAVGSQRRFCRPILPASHSAHTLERQLQSHRGMLESFTADLTYLQQNPPQGRRAKAKELEEQRVRAEYLQHEMCRYETYVQALEAWTAVKKTDALSAGDLKLFDRAVCGEEDDEHGGLKKSHSSPSLDQEMAPPTIKVRRNISERRTYRRTIVPRWNKDT